MAEKSLFSRILLDTFDSLPTTMQQLHNGTNRVFHGRCDVQRGNGMLSRLIGAIVSLPPAGNDQAISVSISCGEHSEYWTRQFDRTTMRSRLRAQGDLLIEHLGPISFGFRLRYNSTQQALLWQIASVQIIGILLPLAWFSAVTAQESESAECYRFDVRAALPLVGLLVHYSGWLDV